jgi:hypothetical protein
LHFTISYFFAYIFFALHHIAYLHAYLPYMHMVHINMYALYVFRPSLNGIKNFKKLSTINISYRFYHRYTGIGPPFFDNIFFLIWSIFPPSAVNYINLLSSECDFRVRLITITYYLPSAVNNINLLSAAVFYPHNIWLLSI